MRRFCFIVWLVLESGCSSYRVHCDSHLRPINPPRAVDVAQKPLDTPARSLRASTADPEDSGSP